MFLFRRIRDNEYEFPADRVVSFEVQELVQQILTPNPQERPTLHEIIDHEWFTRGLVPDRIPVTAHDSTPTFTHITGALSRANLARLRRNALLDVDDTTIAVPSAPSTASSKHKSATSSLAQQEKEFQKAVQPGSPISALLGAARQPLVVGPGTMRGEQPLIRKLQAAREAKSSGRTIREAARGMHHDDDVNEEAKQEDHRRKELEAQKARIVAQMVPGSRPGSASDDADQENMPPPDFIPSRRAAPETKKTKELLAPTPAPAPAPQPDAKSSVKANGFDAAAETLAAAFNAKARGRLFREPRMDADLPEAKVFIVSWVDYCNKYGMGYALTDGSVGVYFNDSTTIVLSPDGQYVFSHLSLVYAHLINVLQTL